MGSYRIIKSFEMDIKGLKDYSAETIEIVDWTPIKLNSLRNMKEISDH